jgi:hypothetical protein
LQKSGIFIAEKMRSLGLQKTRIFRAENGIFRIENAEFLDLKN